jgi:hypothetical protein
MGRAASAFRHSCQPWRTAVARKSQKISSPPRYRTSIGPRDLRLVGPTLTKREVVAVIRTNAGVLVGRGGVAWHEADVLLADKDVEARWGQKRGFMSDLRARGLGPPHLRLSPKVVRYTLADVLAYEEAQKFDNAAAGRASEFKAPTKNLARLPTEPARIRKTD